ncbi:MAG TPA: hypothetical protein VGE52_06805 [Pirellulales bacterium]
MNLLLDESPSQVEPNAAVRLRTTTAAMRLSFTWFGVRKALSAEQKACAADAFGAEGDFVSAGKKLIDTRDPAFRAVGAVRRRTGSYFRGVSLPFPEPGVRLIRRGDLEEIDDRMRAFRIELSDAVVELNESFESLRSAARRRLGRLYNPDDYPASLLGLFDLAWDFPSIEPPPYLQQLSPDLYRQETVRVQARFDEAVRLAEQAFVEELSKLTSHLAERLSGEDDCKPKVFRDSAVENLTAFFESFRRLNIRSNAQLDDLVERAQRIVRGVAPQELRADASLRQEVGSQLAGVQAALDDLLVDRPRRRILRGGPSRGE